VRTALQAAATGQPTHKHSRAHDFLLGILPLLVGLEILCWLAVSPAIVEGRTDFRHMYVAGYMIRTGHSHEVYDYDLQHRFQDELISREPLSLPFNHPPFEAILFVPLSFLSYKHAYLAWFLTNAAILLICFWLLRPWLGNLSRKWKWLPIFLIVLFFPVEVTLMQGQDSILLLVIFISTFAMLNKGQDVKAGAIAGLGLFKFQLLLPFIAVYLLRRHWRVCIGFALSASAISGLSLSLVGVNQMVLYLHSLGAMSFALSTRDQLRYSIVPNAMENLRGLVYGLTTGRLPNSYIQVATLLLSAALLAFLVLKTSKLATSAELALPAIVFSVLASYHLFAHDQSVLLLPVLLAVERTTDRIAKGTWLLAWSSVATYLAGPFMLITPGHLYLASVVTLLFFVALISSSRSVAYVALARPV
jgi:alpha-1,2-mannosyltransferase